MWYTKCKCFQSVLAERFVFIDDFNFEYCFLVGWLKNKSWILITNVIISIIDLRGHKLQENDVVLYITFPLDLPKCTK